MRRREAGASDREHDGKRERERARRWNRGMERELEGSGGRGRLREERQAGGMEEGGRAGMKMMGVNVRHW